MSRRNVEAEQAVLGGIMLAPDAYWRVSGLLTADDFSHPGHGLIWQAIRESLQPLPGSLATPVDPLTLGEWFNVRGKASVVQNGAYLMELYSTTPSAANIVAYAEIVAKRAEAQRVQDAGRRIAACDNFADAQDLLAEARPQQAQRVKTVKDGVSGILDAMALRASGPVGLSWGISEVDRVIGKLVGSRLYGIAGRAKMGKTTASLAPQLAAVRAGKRVLNFSLEMTVAELTQRLLASVGQFDADFFERDDGVPDEAWPMIHEAAKQIIGSGLMIDDEPGLTLDKICGRATQIHMEEPLDLIVVDHMGLIHLPKRGNRNDELGEVSYTLKNLSKKLNVPILALLQLNRGLESRTDKRPTMPDIRDSGNIEQDFDCIVGVYRDEVYNPNSPDEGHAELIAIANRHRKAATAFVRAHMETMTYGPATRERRCFPGGTGSSGNGGQGGGFAGYGAKGGQSRSFSGVRGND